jgi:hypothetical protein
VLQHTAAIQAQLDDIKDQLLTLGLIIYHSVEGKEISRATEVRVNKLRMSVFPSPTFFGSLE